VTQSASLYVGDLHPDVAEGDLFDLFNGVGSVASIRVLRDAVTRRSLGYAYVNFHLSEDATRALDTLNYTSVKGRPIRIMWSQRDPSLRKSGAGNVFVKNLHPDIDNKQLYDTFSLFGNILSCKVSTDIYGKSKGFGFVHYETAAAAETAIKEVNGMLLGDKPVFVGAWKRAGERRSTHWTNLYVKNIPKVWDDEKLAEFFGEAGKVVSAKVQKDGEDISRGFGYVAYDTHEEAVAALETMNEKTIKDGEGDDAPELTLLVTRHQKKSERSRELRDRFDREKSERAAKMQGTNVYVKNLDDAVDEERLRTEFAAYGTIVSCRVMRDESSHSRGFGFVAFSTPEEAQKSIAEMNGRMVMGKPIYVALAQPKSVRRAQLMAQFTQFGPMAGGGGRMGPMGGPAPYGMYPYGAPAGGMMGGRMGGYPQMMPRMGGGHRGGFMGPGGQQMGGGYGGGHMRGPRRGGRHMRGGHMRGGPRGDPRGDPRMYQQGPPAQMAQGGPAPAQMGGAPAMPMAGPPVPPAPVAAPTAPAAAPEGLTAAALANAPPEQQKNMIGERLYPLIHRSQPELAGKITGMLLEMENTELLHLLESPESLMAKINEALQVLKEHMDAQAGTAGAPVSA
jgi:polyadenylate-binding protein